MLALSAFTLGAVFAALGVSAAIPDAAGVFHACVAKSNGTVRIVESACKSSEEAVTWNTAGPAGPAGADGAPGSDGSPGERGPSDAYIVRSDGPTEIATWPASTTVASLDLPAGDYALSAKAVAVNPSTGVEYQGAAITCGLSTGEYSGLSVDGGQAGTIALQDLLTMTGPGSVTLACYKSYPADDTHSGHVRMAKITATQVGALHG